MAEESTTNINTMEEESTTTAMNVERLRHAASSLLRMRSLGPDETMGEATGGDVGPGSVNNNITTASSSLHQYSTSSSSAMNNLNLDDGLQISSDTMVPLTSLSSYAVPSESAPLALPKKKSRAAPKKASKTTSQTKYSVKPKDPKRDTSVPFDEMKRLMRVYGSLKCLRNRAPKGGVDSQSTAKAESIKRKFYRWFPDLDERFVRTEEGWYVPIAGHEEEMAYRERMRKGDQDSLIKKRNDKRSSKKCQQKIDSPLV